jgi:hypothetical protein
MLTVGASPARLRSEASVKRSMSDAELKAITAQIKKLTPRVEKLLNRILRQKPVSERQLEKALRSRVIGQEMGR